VTNNNVLPGKVCGKKGKSTKKKSGGKEGSDSPVELPFKRTKERKGNRSLSIRKLRIEKLLKAAILEKGALRSPKAVQKNQS